MEQIRIGYLSTMYHTSHILKHLGWVEKHLRVRPQWKLFGTGPSMVEAFSTGELDIGYIGLPPAMIGIDRGLPLTCIAGGHVEGTAVIARQGYEPLEDGDIGHVLGQFQGKRIGAPSQGSIHDVIIRHLLNTCNIQAEVVNYPWADLIPEAMGSGDIEAAAGTPPLAVLAEKWYGHCLVVSPAHLWPFNPSYGIVVTRSMFRENTLLESFVRIHETACNLIIQSPGEAAGTVADAVKVVDRQFVLDVFAVSPRYCASLPRDYIDATMKFVQPLQDMGYLKKSLSEEDVFDLSLITKIHPEPHHYHEPLKKG